MSVESSEFPDLPTIRDIIKNDPDYLDAFLDTPESGDFLGYGSDHMKLMRKRGTGPRFVKLPSGAIRYTRRWLFQYIWSGGKHGSTRAAA